VTLYNVCNFGSIFFRRTSTKSVELSHSSARG